MDDESRYVLPDQLTFHAAVFCGCTAQELFAVAGVWSMFWTIVLGVLAISSGVGIMALAPIILLTGVSFFITAFVIRGLRNNRPPGALVQTFQKKMDSAGFIQSRFIVEPGTLTGSRSRQLVNVQNHLVRRLPEHDRGGADAMDPDYEDT